MENRRYIGFAITIGAGLILGLIMGWSVFPRKASEMPLKELRMDYKTDYVLMVATIYKDDMDYDAAVVRLSLLDEDIEQLLIDASQIASMEYSVMDSQTINLLLQVVKNHAGILPIEGRYL